MANITISTNAAQDARIIAAFKARLGPGTTGADVKAWLIGQLKQAVLDYERNEALKAANVTEIEPT